ncbi:PRC-barrel domain containing protein [Paraburkholderia gardini]|uniref:PRC-barrel domain protein n=1 Tax=Paraburkholderia gardini TaxID=2823469 RepID=A0ABN7QNH9_9BURK|nr:PRC-barrel domain containing protein [Paraburkholderia gardini]CAG4901965.1 hypothetical protein R54767_02799 [Paraburkholderia gardini]
MSGGFPRPAFRLAILIVLAAWFLSGCSLLELQSPAPIRDAEAIPAEPEAPPLVIEDNEPEQTDTSGHPVPKKPKHPVVKPHKVEEPPPPVPASAPPAPPPPIITTRTIERNTAHGLLDSEVQRPDGKVVGRAVDLITDASGTPREMVVNLLGFLGIGDRKANFPWNAFRFAPAAKGAPITINMPQGKLPFSIRPKLAGPLAGTSPPPVSPGQLPLLDTNVERANGDKVGRIIDVLIDGAAQPQAVVLDVSGIINPDRRTIAANWSALHFVTKNKELTPLIDLSEAQIKASPSYTTDGPIRAVSPAPPAPAAPPAPSPAPAPAPARATASASSSTAAASSVKPAR